MRAIKVEVRPGDERLAEHWTRLARQAAPNVFMNPVALRVAQAHAHSPIHVLLGWAQDGGPQRLVGLWALRELRIGPLLPRVLAGPPYDYAFFSNPAVDPDCADDVLAAFLDTIEQDPRFPKLLRLRYLDADSRSYEAMNKALAARAARCVALSPRERPVITKASEPQRAGSTRKKLRQHWNRLCAVGRVQILCDRSPQATASAFEAFLRLEAASWKGSRGTALLCKERDARFGRDLINTLASRDEAAVALLTVDGRPVAAQVLLFCGPLAYTWKTAFDKQFGQFSPGALLVEKIGERLLATPGIDAVESCSSDGSFMNQIWDGRRTTIDCAAQIGPGPSAAFELVVAGELLRAHLRARRSKPGSGAQHGEGLQPLRPLAKRSEGGTQPHGLRE